MKILITISALFFTLSSSSSAQLGDPLWKDVCTQDDVKFLPFCDSKLGLKARVADYVERIPIGVQISMMANTAHGFDDLHIPEYQWWSEGLHGPVQDCLQDGNRCYCPTSFPCPSGLGNAFNASLYYAIGAAIGVEARAFNNLKIHRTELFDGLTYWSPVINLQRDPRWGRNQEAPGEDPVLTSVYAVNFVQGLQGDGDVPNVAACCKHFVANSLEKWFNHTRHNFDAQISMEDLYDYYFPPFQECVKYSMGVMCSYNSLNGQPACANDWLLKKVLREKWNFTGYITTDCGAVEDIYEDHHYAKDGETASAMSVNASVDLNCGDNFMQHLGEALKKDLIEESKIRESFSRLATIQFQLGLFDPKTFSPKDDYEKIDSPENRALALDAALQSIVLLQNNDQMLPLNPDMKLAVIGPHLNASAALLSNYHGDKCSCVEQVSEPPADCLETPYEAIQKHSNHPLIAVLGCEISSTTAVNEIEQAVQAAKEADAAIVILGLDLSQESEGHDRTITHLPGIQPKLLDAILGVASDKTVLVLLHGGSLSLGPNVLKKTPAIISASYGGQSGSHALASVLFGDYNPTGKLSSTWYPSKFVDDLPLTEMGLRVGVGRTHLYYKGTPEFAFGHGLSYSKWDVNWIDSNTANRLILDAGLSTGETATIEVSAKNMGPFTGQQTLLLFWRPKTPFLDIREKLIGFEGTELMRDGDEAVVVFRVAWNDFALWNQSSNVSEASLGEYELEVRASEIRIQKSIHLVNSKAGDEQFIDSVQ